MNPNPATTLLNQSLNQRLRVLPMVALLLGLVGTSQALAELQKTSPETSPIAGTAVKRFESGDMNKPGDDTGAHFTITRKDENFRQALKRWTTDAGWEFEPEHWAVPRDIPIAGTADFGGDFRAAVQALLKSSELGDQPVQACFYSNKVLRVVPINELCARSSS
ncbi:MAG: toxin co-regulated pilus biosynthesis Q family protein [Rhodoferax sp.]|nr:toxin co-regulated pilus biosynthesis Q family protein [Rhodoferax sp.]